LIHARFVAPLSALVLLTGCPVVPAGVPTPGGSVVPVGPGPGPVGTTTPSVTVGTVAGSGDAGLADGKGAGAKFDHPQGLAFDAKGTLYVADTGNNAIRRANADGTVETWLGASGEAGFADGSPAEARFSAPRALVAAKDGTLYVADTGNKRIRKIAPDGTVSTLAGGGTGSEPADGVGEEAVFGEPSGLALDGDGNVLVIDAGALREVAPDGTVKTLVAAKAGLVAAVVGPDGQLALLAKTGIFKLQDGKAVAIARLPLEDPTSLVVVDGNYFVVDAGSGANRLLYVKGDGQAVAIVEGSSPDFADGAAKDARLATPHGLAIAPGGVLVLADTGNNRLRTIQLKAAVAPPVPVGPNVGPAPVTVQGDRPPALPGGDQRAQYVVTTLASVNGATLPDGAAQSKPDAAGMLIYGAPLPHVHFYDGTIAVDAAGAFYVAKGGDTHWIRRVTSDGKAIAFAGSQEKGPKDGARGVGAIGGEIRHMEFDRAGNLIFDDGGAIRALAPDGSMTTHFDAKKVGNSYYDANPYGQADGQFTTGLSLQRWSMAPDGTLLLSTRLQQVSSLPGEGDCNLEYDPFNPSVLKQVCTKEENEYFLSSLSPSGEAHEYGSAGDLNFYQLAVDSKGNLYANRNPIPVFRAGSIKASSPSATLYKAGESGNVFRFDANDNLYIYDEKLGAIVAVDPSGNATVIAGTLGKSAADGPGTSARFANPLDIAIGADGTLYVLDRVGDDDAAVRIVKRR
jgi:sugar lactone lactonase YvrE